MKISKIPGLGRFGVYIDQVDLNNISDEEWLEIGNIHLQNLVTIIRAPKISYEQYYKKFLQWGTPRWNRPIYFLQKYGKPLREILRLNLFDEEDQQMFHHGRNWQIDKRYPGMIRVTAKKDKIKFKTYIETRTQKMFGFFVLVIFYLYISIVL